MSEPKTNPVKHPVPPHVEMKMKSFPAAFIKAKPGENFAIAGKIGSSITSNRERPENRDYHWIEYVPDMDHFAVTFMRRVDGPVTEYVHCSNVGSWAPIA
jgi:hypothetical protein